MSAARTTVGNRSGYCCRRPDGGRRDRGRLDGIGDVGWAEPQQPVQTFP
jgi:hypothetical protein